MMTGRLDGKRAIITGAASGIGRECTFRFLREGARVAALDVSLDGVEDLARLTNCRAWLLDVTVSSDVERVFGQAIEWLEGVDVLVNSAGVTSAADPLELEEEEFDRVMNVNVKGTFLCCQAAGREMRRAGGGSIVNISSVAAELATGQHLHYAASKGAVRMLTKALAVGLADDGIRVNAVGPGPVMTEMQRSIVEKDPEQGRRLLNRVLRGRGGDPEEIAASVLFLASDEAAFVNGTTLYTDGGVLAAR